MDMLSTCKYVTRMSKMIQIRNVPDAIHRKLKIRAVEEGMTLSDLLAREARQLAERPTLGQMRSRLLRRERETLAESAAVLVREVRGKL
jgi:plasmid stability protein